MPRQPKVTGKGQHRLTLQIPAAKKRQLIELQRRLGASSMVEVVGRALELLEIAVDAKDEQGSLVVRKSSGEESKLLIL